MSRLAAAGAILFNPAALDKIPQLAEEMVSAMENGGSNVKSAVDWYADVLNKGGDRTQNRTSALLDYARDFLSNGKS